MTPIRTAALDALRNGRVTVLMADRAVLGVSTEPPARVMAVVASSREDRRVPYLISLRAGDWTCTCQRPDCAHIASVQLVTGHPSAAQKEEPAR